MSEVAEKYGIDLYTEGKVACPKCREKGMDNSGDNLMVYGTDREGRHKGAHCWGGCGGFTILSEDELEKRGITEEKEYDLVGSLFNADIHEQLKAQTTNDSFGYRGIRKDTTTFFGVRHEIDGATGAVSAQLYPCTQEAENDMGFELTGYKKRIIPKDFAGIGETGKDCHMFGQWRFLKKRSRDILIVGGEVDQLSAYQMLADFRARENAKKGQDFESTFVVSPTIGESGAYKQIVGQYEFFNRFDRVIICMDNDAAGREAAEKIAKALPKGKAYIMEMSMKDPNSYMWDKEKNQAVNRQGQFITEFFASQPYTPNGIVGSGSLLSLMKAAAVIPKIPLPAFMHKVQKMMAGGIPLGRIVNLGSASGTGKSTIVDEMVYFWIFHSPHKVGVVSLESDCAEYGIKMASRHIGQKLELIEDMQYKIDLMNTPEFEAAVMELTYNEDGSHRWHLLDERDGGLDDLKEKVMELIISCDCKVIILDPLQDILDGMSNEEQAVFMRWQKGLVKSHKVTFININHVRKSGQGGKQNSAGADLFEEDFQGSSSIFKSGACNLLFTRNKEAECEIERNITYMKMTKCRWTGNTGPKAGEYFYNNKEHTLYDLEDYLNRNPAAAAEYVAGQMAKEQAESSKGSRGGRRESNIGPWHGGESDY